MESRHIAFDEITRAVEWANCPWALSRNSVQFSPGQTRVPDCLDSRLQFKPIGNSFRGYVWQIIYISPRTVIPSPSFYNHAVAHCRCSGCPERSYSRFVHNNPVHDRVFNVIGIGTTTRSRGTTTTGATDRRSWTHDFDAELLGSSVFRQRRYCREI